MLWNITNSVFIFLEAFFKKVFLHGFSLSQTLLNLLKDLNEGVFRVVIRKSSHNSDILFYTGCTSCCGVFIVASQFARFIKAELLKHDKCLSDLLVIV